MRRHGTPSVPSLLSSAVCNRRVGKKFYLSSRRRSRRSRRHIGVEVRRRSRRRRRSWFGLKFNSITNLKYRSEKCNSDITLSK